MKFWLPCFLGLASSVRLDWVFHMLIILGCACCSTWILFHLIDNNTTIITQHRGDSFVSKMKVIKNFYGSNTTLNKIALNK